MHCDVACYCRKDGGRCRQRKDVFCTMSRDGSVFEKSRSQLQKPTEIMIVAVFDMGLGPKRGATFSK